MLRDAGGAWLSAGHAKAVSEMSQRDPQPSSGGGPGWGFMWRGWGGCGGATVEPGDPLTGLTQGKAGKQRDGGWAGGLGGALAHLHPRPQGPSPQKAAWGPEVPWRLGSFPQNLKNRAEVIIHLHRPQPVPEPRMSGVLNNSVGSK